MEKAKINGRKLALTLLIYIFGYIILIFLMSFVLAILQIVPVIDEIVNSWFGLFIYSLIGFFSVVILIVFSENVINKLSKKTHLLSTFIFGIVFVTIQALFMVINFCFSNLNITNVFLLLTGIMCIVIGKDFEYQYAPKKQKELVQGSIDKFDDSAISKTTIDTPNESVHNDIDSDVLKIHNMNLKKFIELINNHFKQFSISKEQKVSILQECFNLYISKILSLDMFNEELKMLQDNLLLGFLKAPFSSFNKTLLKNIDENKSYDGSKQYKVKFLSEDKFNVLYHTIFRLFNVTEYCKFIDSKNYISYMSNEIFYIVTTKSTGNSNFPLNYDNFPSEKATAIITFCATCWDYTDNFIKIFVEEYYAEYYNK